MSSGRDDQNGELSTGARFAGGLALLLSRGVLGGLFVFAAGVKLADPQTFSGSIQGFAILPDHLVGIATFAVPWIEMVAAVALILGFWPRAAAATLVGMLVGFIVLILSALARGLTIECGCFGKIELLCSGPLGWCNVAQNLGLIVVGLPALIWGGGMFGVHRERAPSARAVPA